MTNLKLITDKEAAENMLTNANNSMTIYRIQIAFYEFVANKKTDKKVKANWLVERDKVKAQMKSMQESIDEMTPFVASYN